MQLVSGTWDFKWPQGTAIRVAFQELPEAQKKDLPELKYLIGIYVDTASRWLQKRPNIHFDFSLKDGPFLPAPGLETDPNDPKKPPVQSARSPRRDGPIPYDVLVSFAPLPVHVFVENEPANEGTFPGQLSVLGSYARRANYGIPTTLVGPNQNFVPDGTQLRDYYDDDIFQTVIVHEVGHMLGIAHQHQNPRYANRPELKDKAAIQQALAGIQKKYRTEFSPQVDEEIRDLWPTVVNSKGEIQYSDWGEINVAPGRRLENFTALAHPIWSDLVEAKEPFEPLVTLTGPTDWDLEQLEAMYPPR